MKHTVPRSPLATALSGSDKETELRIRNIVLGPKKRPPVWLLPLVFLGILSCGNLVGCRSMEPPQKGPVPPASDTQASDDLSPDRADSSGAYSPPVKAAVSDYAERLVWKEHDLTAEQKAHLLALDPKTLPRKPVDLSAMLRSQIFEDILIPMAWDEAADVTLYGVVDPASVPDKEPSVNVPSVFLDTRGIALRHGDQLTYVPLEWGGNAWSSGNPWMRVADFNGDGQEEAAICLFSDHGTGVSVSSLYFFDLNSMTYSVPDWSTLDIDVSYAPESHACTLSSGAHTLLVPLPDYIAAPKAVDCGNIVSFFEDDGAVFLRAALDFSGMTLGYLAEVTAPVLFENGRYVLGPASSLTQIEA